jgi:maltose alpha-D-glucosyltransferase/alpha-amylase
VTQDGLLSDELLRYLSTYLPAFLPEQRWFGGKARTIASCQVEDVADLPGATADAALIIAGVSYSDGQRDRYVLLVSRRPDARGLPSLGRLAPPDGDWIVEAATDPDTIRTLLRGFTGAAVATRRGGSLRYADVGDAARRVLADAAAPVRAVGNEQSNTSLRLGSTLVFKLFRRLETGENPELEVGRFLTSRTTFRAMSSLEGSLTYVSPDGQLVTLGVLQTWIDNQGDGWSYVISALGEHLRTGTPPPQLAPDMTRLGVITADFHTALASDSLIEAFRPEPVQRSDIGTWSAEVIERLSRARAAIESRLGSWPDQTRRLGASVLSKSHLASAIVAASQRAPATFQKMRIHGDYHLGQTLKTPSGFAIIDFEGEPARPIADRRQKHCALKDVAGMLRSFDYAIESALSQGPDMPDRLRKPAGLRDAFLDGYLQSAAERETASIPTERSALAHWLTFFEFEKALYELEYEVNNRPEWVHIPLRGILHALDAQAP